jgi:hypothetical protein
MVKINRWEEINKALYRNQMPKVISARELMVLRCVENIFSGLDKEKEVHQCFCGQIFIVSRQKMETVPKDFLGLPVCPKCGNSPENVEDAKWRTKFTLAGEITQAMRDFEECEENKRDEALKKIRSLTKGEYEFSTIGEMRAKYHKFIEKVQAEDLYQIAGPKPEWVKILDSLFEKAKDSDIATFVELIFSTDALEIRQVMDTILLSQEAIVRMEKDYFLSKISDYPDLPFKLNMEIIKKSRVRFSLLVYSHIIELEALYNLTANLILASEGKRIKANPFDETGRKSGLFQWLRIGSTSKKSFTNSGKKLKTIKNMNRQVGKLLYSFYMPNVRNAFSHSKYKIENGFFYKTDENFKISADKLETKINRCKAYWDYLQARISDEVAIVYEKGIVKGKDGTTVTVTTSQLPE